MPRARYTCRRCKGLFAPAQFQSVFTVSYKSAYCQPCQHIQYPPRCCVRCHATKSHEDFLPYELDPTHPMKARRRCRSCQDQLKGHNPPPLSIDRYLAGLDPSSRALTRPLRAAVSDYLNE